MSAPEVPAYFDSLLAGYHQGLIGRSVHLGHWDRAETDGFAAAQARLDERVLALAEVADGQRVLDVGCGLGGTIERIERRHQRVTLTGVNVDPRQIQICAELAARPRNRVGWVLADACQLPFAVARFDRVLCVEAMFHFRSRAQFFTEAARVLAPGGLLAVTDMVLDPARLGPHRAEIVGRLRAGYGPWPDPFAAEGNHQALARAAGLEPVAAVDASTYTRPSHRYTVPDGDSRDGADPMLAAGRMLRDLHLGGALTYLYLTFGKPRGE